jgi:hypothetical protein
LDGGIKKEFCWANEDGDDDEMMMIMTRRRRMRMRPW